MPSRSDAPSRTRRVGSALLHVVVVLAVAGCATGPEVTAAAARTPAPAPAVTSSAPATPSPPARALPDVPVVAATPPPVSRPGPRPVRLVLPSVDIDAPVEPVGVRGDGQMALPPHPDRAGWYRWSARPSDPVGRTVLGAHVDSLRYGIGQFARLRDTEDGAPLVLRTADGRETRYRVVAVQQMDKRDVQLDRLFDRDGDPAVAVLTCGGKFDPEEGGYQDNVVLVAVPEGAGAG